MSGQARLQAAGCRWGWAGFHQTEHEDEAHADPEYRALHCRPQRVLVGPAVRLVGLRKLGHGVHEGASEVTGRGGKAALASNYGVYSVSHAVGSEEAAKDARLMSCREASMGWGRMTRQGEVGIGGP